MNQGCHRWTVQATDLTHLTAVKARDLIIKCLLEAQRENFAQNEQVLGHTPGEPELRAIVEGTIRLAFREIDQDYDNPSRESLMKVVGVIVRKSRTWGTPSEIIDHHKRQIARVMHCLLS